jgi:hypothetical protein
MKIKQVLFFAFLLLTATNFAQSSKKMSNNLRVFITDNFDKKTSISIQTSGIDKGGAVGNFTNTLVSYGFKTISATAHSNKTEIDESKTKTENKTDKKTTISNFNYVKSNYLFTIQYTWAYRVPGNEIQCKNFTGQIVDLNNDSEIIATFSYPGNFDMVALAMAVADRLNSVKLKVVLPSNEQALPVEEKSNILQPKNQVKTKEEKLIELKGFYEKQLITKEEYEEQKKNILQAE